MRAYEQLKERFFEENPDLIEQQENIMAACDVLIKSYEDGGKLLIAGNGGSAADADHIVGELMKGFKSLRPLSGVLAERLSADLGEDGELLASGLQRALPAISLTSNSALLTAFINDVNPALAIAQVLSGYAVAGDVFLGISTSGNSRNIILAMKLARALGLRTIALTGGTGGALAELAEICITSPADETFRIQEYHLPIYHFICAYLEAYFFED